MSLVLRVLGKMHLCRSSSNAPRPPLFLEMLQNPHVLRGAQSLAPATQNDTWTSRNAPYLYLSVFHAFDLGVCFAPQRRALFRHPNFQKWSETVSFQHFWLRNVLRATTVSIFSTFQLPKVVQEWCALYILTSKCASRHSVQFFISHLARWLRTRRFSEPTFRPGATNQSKNTASRNFSTFSRAFIFFLLWSSLFFSSLLWLCTPLLLHMSVLSGVWPLNFLRSVYGRIHAWLFLCDYAWLREVVGAYACTHAWQSLDIFFPVVPRKGVAEVSKIGHYRGGELLWCMDGRANPLMDQKVVGVFFLEWLPSGCNGCSGHLPTTAGCSVV